MPAPTRERSGPDPQPGPLDTDGVAEDARLWRAVHAFRVAALLYAVVLHALAQDGYRHPAAAWLVLAGLAVWTVVLRLVRRRGPVVMVTDLLVAVAAILSTAVLDDPERIRAGAQTLPSIWVAAAVLAWAVWRGWRGGLAAAVILGAADVVEVSGRLSAATINNIVLLLLAGTVVGYAVELFRAGRRDLALAVSVKSATAERERLARDIHDSVLQVLAYVQRRGQEVGGEAAEIGRLAGEQEARLRSLVSTGPPLPDARGDSDVRALLSEMAGTGVTVTGPAEPVLLPAGAAHAVAGAVREALDNVRRHAGEGARAWVLVEDEGSVVTVTVRDDGVGFAEGRLAAAESEGRLGVSSSITRRVRDAGGTAHVVGVPGQGTEVELRMARGPVRGTR